jgi:hypothetical protein
MQVREQYQFGKVGLGGIDWIYLAQGKYQRRDLLNMVVNLQVPKDVGKFLSIFITNSFSTRAQLHGINELILKET